MSAALGWHGRRRSSLDRGSMVRKRCFGVAIGEAVEPFPSIWTGHVFEPEAVCLG